MNENCFTAELVSRSCKNNKVFLRMLVEATFIKNLTNQKRDNERRKNTLLIFEASWPVFRKYLNDE